MADFAIAYEKVLAHEGGYVNDPDDPGGETYRGVARKMHSKWEGWVLVDILKTKQGFPASLDNDLELQELIKTFYRTVFWDRVHGDEIDDQDVAISIFDFAVNAGLGTSASLAQMVVGAKTDGIIGPKSIGKINTFSPDHFLAEFTVAKIARYINIVKKRPTSRKYFYGWVCRSLNGI